MVKQEVIKGRKNSISAAVFYIETAAEN